MPSVGRRFADGCAISSVYLLGWEDFLLFGLGVIGGMGETGILGMLYLGKGMIFLLGLV